MSNRKRTRGRKFKMIDKVKTKYYQMGIGVDPRTKKQKKVTVAKEKRTSFKQEY